MCLLTILDKLPFLQKILYEQNAKKFTIVAYAKPKIYI